MAHLFHVAALNPKGCRFESGLCGPRLRRPLANNFLFFYFYIYIYITSRARRESNLVIYFFP